MATPVSPISFCPLSSLEAPTVDSAKATELEVPSVTSRIDLHCWWAKSPVYGAADQFWPLPPRFP